MSGERAGAPEQANPEKDNGTGAEMKREEAAAGAPRARKKDQLRKRSSEDRECGNYRRWEGETPRMTHEGRHKQRVPQVSLSSAKLFPRDRSSKRKASSSQQSARSKGHELKGRHIEPPIGEGRLTAWATPDAMPPRQKGPHGK